MRARLTRALATAVLMVSLLVPFASGWAMALGVADGRLMVICSGDGLRIIQMDEDGNATQISDEAIACVLKSALDTAVPPRPEPQAQRLAFTLALPIHSDLSRQDRTRLTPLPRAPPMI